MAQVPPELEAEAVPLLLRPQTLGVGLRKVQLPQRLLALRGRRVHGADDAQPMIQGVDCPSNVLKLWAQYLLQFVLAVLFLANVANPWARTHGDSVPELRGLTEPDLPPSQGKAPAIHAVQIIHAVELADVQQRRDAAAQQARQNPLAVALRRGVERRDVHRPNPDAQEVIHEPLHILEPHQLLLANVGRLNLELQGMKARK
mmetsp:Transcript_120795/g.352845  ORF Transcript_120795/g.352845 Transcript_120795/m.352845 type:complete len:202 (+) Transcript_120795:665-1270(+)